MNRFQRLILCALFALCSLCASAYDFSAENDEGVTIYYDYVSKSTLAPKAKVTYKSYSSYNSYSGVVVIPKTVTYNGTTYSVTSIGNYAFRDCTRLTEVTIPESVTEIGEYAFYGCTRLTEVTIPESMKEIGDRAFANFTGLTNITIPKNIKSIGGYAFGGCTSLTSITIPESVTSIGGSAFDGCSALTEVTIPNSITEIDHYTFRDCSALTEVTIPNSVTTIGEHAFGGCSGLTEVVILEGVTTIGYYAFNGCTGLRSIYSLNPEPPLCYTSTFTDVRYNLCTVYVPEGTKIYYELDTVWGEFYFIEEFDATTVSNIHADEGKETINRYTLDGKAVETPQRGINILRYSDGTSKKVLVK